MTEAWIVSAARTPIGRAFKGSLIECRPDDLTALAIRAALERVPKLDPEEVEDVIVGCGQPAGESGYNVARVATLLAGIPNAGGVTVNRYCSSSLMTIRMAAHAILAGEGDVFVAGGVETVSRFAKGRADGMEDTRNPKFAEASARTTARMNGDQPDWTPPDGLPDIYITMGETAENVAELKGVTREEMDAFACESQRRAVEARDGGIIDREIVPVTTPSGNEVKLDDGPRPGTTVDKLATLKPVFRPNGRITAGNACPLNDGAAAVVVMSDTRAKALGIEPRARVVASGVSALSPEIMGLGPIEASRRALKRAGLSMSDIDVVELNEAFAAQVIPCMKELDIPHEKLNVHGGAIALGHPFGMTGARIMTTLLNALDAKQGRYGLETMCVGGGQGMAMIVERL